MEPSVVTDLGLYRPRPVDLAAFLPYACGQLQASFGVTVLQVAEEFDGKSDVKNKKAKRSPTREQASTMRASSGKGDSLAARDPDRDLELDDDVVVRVRCDAADRPLELAFHRSAPLPRLLFQVLGLCVPFHPQLEKITIRRGALDGSVLYEIAKFLPASRITEIRLDDSPVAHLNHFLLLERPTRLRSLGLARCGLDDDDVAQLAARLAHPLPASRTLAVLSLEGNRVTDAGARALADALRTNRTLRHLNLAGNRIGNRGATDIFRTLMRFPISAEELEVTRRRTFEYLKARRETYRRCLRELSAASDAESARGPRRTMARSRRGSAVTLASLRSGAGEALAIRADAMASELLGPLAEPFEASALTTRDGVTSCAGNFALCYLNLAYNELDCVGAARLAEVLAYQAGSPQCAGGGLVRVVLEGTRVAAGCGGALAAAALLESRVAAGAAAAYGFQIRSGRRSERSKSKSS